MIEAIRSVLSNSFIFSFKALSYHWNVEGEKFLQLHDFFGEVYEEVNKSLDHTAEILRTLGEFAPKSIAEMYMYSDIREDSEIPPDCRMMISNLFQDNNILIDSIEHLIAEADEDGSDDIMDAAIKRLEAHKKYKWFLTSILK